MDFGSRRFGLRALSAVVVLGTVGASTYVMAMDADANTGPQAAPVRLVVGFKPGADGAATVQRVTAAGLGVGAQDELANLNARTLEVADVDSAVALADLRKDPRVEYVEVDSVVHKADVTPNDRYFDEQVSLGQIKVPAAWEVTTGMPSVTVAVVDTGVSQIEELAGAVVGGYDFVNDDPDASDDGEEGHGTGVASLIAARGDNGAGIAGVCWSCKIMPVKVIDEKGKGLMSDVAKGIAYAADNGATIINVSLGGPDDATVLRRAVDYATDKGALVIAAAGNEATDTRSYPAAINSVLAVGGTDGGRDRFIGETTDGKIVGSNYGRDWVDVAAPFCNVAMNLENALDLYCGTSGSAPLVAGAAALVLSENPQANAWSVRRALTSTAKRLKGGWLANGEVDAAAAVAFPVDVRPPTIRITRAPKDKATVEGTVVVQADVRDKSGIDSVELLINGRVVDTDTTKAYSFKVDVSTYGEELKVQLRAHDRAGNAKTTATRTWTR